MRIISQVSVILAWKIKHEGFWDSLTLVIKHQKISDISKDAIEN